MIFSELYSAYYNAVANILTAAAKAPIDDASMRRIVDEYAFSESFLTILPALRTGRWGLLDEQRRSILHHIPTMPPTTLERRWLKAIASDPRIRLFGVEMPALAEVSPLFTRADIRVYDQYTDGDPYEDETYIKNFRLLLGAMRLRLPVKLLYRTRAGGTHGIRVSPVGFEYSEKDDKFRLITDGYRYQVFNMARILHCEILPLGTATPRESTREDPLSEVTVMVTDIRNAPERVMLAFSHLEKRVERVDDTHYLLHMNYRASDETEMVVRLLAFGPCVRVTAPARFVDLMRERLIRQKKLFQ